MRNEPICKHGGSNGAAAADGRVQRPASPLTSWLRRLLQGLREFNATNVELRERTALRNQPWREQWLHWSYDGHNWHLHGYLLPPAGGRRLSVTRSGWCPSSRSTSAR